MPASQRLAVVPSWITIALSGITNCSSLKRFMKTLLQTVGKIIESWISLKNPFLSHLFKDVFNSKNEISISMP